MPNHHFKAINALGSRWECDPGEGVTDVLIIIIIIMCMYTYIHLYFACNRCIVFIIIIIMISSNRAKAVVLAELYGWLNLCLVGANAVAILSRCFVPDQ